MRVLKKINKPGNMIVSFTNLAERIKVSTGGNLTYKKKIELVPWVLFPLYCHIFAVVLDFWEWSFVQGPGGAAGRIPCLRGPVNVPCFLENRETKSLKAMCAP